MKKSKNHRLSKMVRNFAPIWLANVVEGKIKLSQPELFKRYLLSIKGEIELIVRKWKKRRSSNQNRYYWGAIIPILCESFGYFDEEMHEALKWKFLRNVKREQLPTVRSTANLSTIEFKNYIDKITIWSLEQGIIIPSPGEIENEN